MHLSDYDDRIQLMFHCLTVNLTSNGAHLTTDPADNVTHFLGCVLEEFSGSSCYSCHTKNHINILPGLRFGCQTGVRM